MHQFSKPGQLLLDAVAGMLSTAKACLLLNNYSRLIGCDKDIDCLQISIPRLVDVYASQLLNDRADFTGDGHLKASARVYLAAVKSGSLR